MRGSSETCAFVGSRGVVWEPESGLMLHVAMDTAAAASAGEDGIPPGLAPF